MLGLAENAAGTVLASGIPVLEDEFAKSDVVVVGPGLDDPEHTRGVLSAVLPLLAPGSNLLLDAFALGVLPDLSREFENFRGSLLLTPNPGEAARLMGVEEISPDQLPDAVTAIAAQYRGVVSCQGRIATPNGATWLLSTGTGGLATSGSGDVLAGAIAGVWARGATLEQAACWGTHLHAAAGDRLEARVGPLGFLARELPAEFPALLVELG